MSTAGWQVEVEVHCFLEHLGLNSSGGRIDGESQVHEVDGVAHRGESPLERSEVQGGLKQFPIIVRTDPDANDIVNENILKYRSEEPKCGSTVCCSCRAQ
jgi:hypothetical protein